MAPTEDVAKFVRHNGQQVHLSADISGLNAQELGGIRKRPELLVAGGGHIREPAVARTVGIDGDSRERGAAELPNR